MDFFLWGYLKNKVYRLNPATVDEQEEKIERKGLTVSNEIIRNDVKSISQLCLESSGH